MKILIGGGGTGGHLVPGVSIYKEFQKQNHELLYVVSERDKAYDISELLKEDDKIEIALTGISRKLSFSTFKQLYSIFKEWRKAFTVIKKFNPDFCVITGGYQSNIVALSALVLRKPLYILEQNSAAGITNRIWAKFAKNIYTTFPAPKFIPTKKEIYTGNPLYYTEILSTEEAKTILGLEVNDKPVIGISGGSQGAKKINDIVLSILPQLMNEGYQVVWSLGTREFERLTSENKMAQLEAYGNNLKAFRFINRMDAFWSASSLVIARSGAGTVSEALYFRVPSLFIPIYKSPDDHQFLNAKYLVDSDCATLIEEPQLSSDKLFNSILDMMRNNHEFKNSFPNNILNPAQTITADIIKKESSNI